MAHILHIESATLTCSVGISSNGKPIAHKEAHDKTYSHAEKLVVFIEEVFKLSGLKASEIDAVCVSKGPGSYTGLRIGVSAAKGFCYGKGIPLVSVGSLPSMAALALERHQDRLKDVLLLCPMVDARRMEVYSALYDNELKEVEPVSAQIIDEQSFATELAKGKVAFFGDGAAKCKGIIQHPNAVFLDDFLPSAEGMMAIAEQKLSANQLEDTAYFEPYYLKDFVAGKPKRVF